MTDELAWESLDRAVAYSCPGFDVVTERVRLPDGTETDFDYVTELESVVVLPFAADGDVVVIEEWRQAVERVSRGLPAGSVEPHDEDLATGARRELAEETGYEAGDVDRFTTVEPANGFADAVFHFFVARGCRKTGAQALEVDESIRTTTASFDDLLAAARRDELRDGRTMLAVLYYALFER